MDKKELICISCPMGCRLETQITEEGEITVLGNKCNRGEIYACEEILSPKRIVTAVVKTNSFNDIYVPIKTDKPLLKELIPSLLEKLYSMEVKVPIKLGDKLFTDFDDSGVNVVFTRSISQ